MSFSFFIQILGFSIGILYLWWEYHADRKVWLASVVMPAISMWIYFSKGLYADFAINIYYLAIAAYGYIAWSVKNHGAKSTDSDNGNNDENQVSLPISHTPLKTWIGISGAAALLWGGIWWILFNFTDSTVPAADSFTTALSIVGLWMMARKYVEQWYVWCVVDIVSAALYFYKGIPFYGVLYGLYTVIAVFGYRKWLRLMRAQEGQDR